MCTGKILSHLGKIHVQLYKVNPKDIASSTNGHSSHKQTAVGSCLLYIIAV